MKKPVAIAIDLGAESCRVSLLRWVEGAPEIRVVHRFANAPFAEGGRLRWDLQGITSGVENGLRLCADNEEIASIGLDGWAVDYVRLGADGRPVANPYCYRDERTVEAEKEVYERISPESLYALTGIQLLRINTLFQLYADGRDGVAQGTPWVNLPEYVTQWLGGERVAEYTNATHTQLVARGTRSWCPSIFEATGLELKAAPKIAMPGTDVGPVRSDMARLPGLRNTRLIVPACHDTASAIAAIPLHGDDWAFISSGTWSLVGTVLDAPCATQEARAKNFTNLGGVGGSICFLKNVNGMWLLRQCMECWQGGGRAWTVSELIRECEKLPEPDCPLDVDDGDLLLPGDMPGRINAQRKRMGLAAIESAPYIANVIFHGLAARYAQVLADIQSITEKKLRRLCVVGGGSRNAYLNRLTAERSGLEVAIGPAEASTIGNFVVQLAALSGDYSPTVGVSRKAVAEWSEVLGRSMEADAEVVFAGRAR